LSHLSSLKEENPEVFKLKKINDELEATLGAAK
jgi:hypothetical protein